MPDQTLVLEWETVKHTVSPDRVQCMQKIAQTAENLKNDWLYNLGFKQFPVDFSASPGLFPAIFPLFCPGAVKDGGT